MHLRLVADSLLKLIDRFVAPAEARMPSSYKIWGVKTDLEVTPLTCLYLFGA